jgi:hypothetical protein
VMRILLVIAVWVGVAMFGAGTSRADEAETKKNIVSFYERMAFVNSDGQLVKMNPLKNLPINVACFAQNCLELTTQLEKYIPNSNMPIYPLKQYHKEFPINIILLAEEKLSENLNYLDQVKLELQPGEHFSKDVSQECVSISIFKDHVIRKIVIVSGNFSSWKKTVSCVVVQLMRSSGMLFTDSFDKLWAKQGKFASSDDGSFHLLLLALGRLVAIHFQPTTRPGMSRTEFEAAIDKLSLYELTGGL